MTYKTSKADFKLFKKEAMAWVEYFSLKDWEVLFEHEPDDEARAYIYINLQGKMATIGLSTTWTVKSTKAMVRSVAFHEVCEMLLGRLSHLGRTRFINPDEIPEALHDVIRRLENTIFRDLK